MTSAAEEIFQELQKEKNAAIARGEPVPENIEEFEKELDEELERGKAEIIAKGRQTKKNALDIMDDITALEDDLHIKYWKGYRNWANQSCGHLDGLEEENIHKRIEFYERHKHETTNKIKKVLGEGVQ